MMQNALAFAPAGSGEPQPPSISAADYWELLTRNGIAPDSATAIVKSHAGMNNPALWDRLVQNGATPDAATAMVLARSGGNADRITRNVAALRAQGATDKDVEAYLTQHEGLTPEPTYNTEINARNLLRSAGQGATFGWSDELGLADRNAQKAFQNAHPIADFFAKITGGALAPAAAIAAAPEVLGGLGGAATIGAASGLLNGAGEGEDAQSRLKGAAFGGLLGGAGGAAGFGVGKVLQGAGSAAAMRVLPKWAAPRAVGKAAQDLIDDPALAASQLADVNRIAPGSASPATTVVARGGTDRPRFLEMARGIGANAIAAAKAEADVNAQRAAIQAGKNRLGDAMTQLETSDIPVTPKVRDALRQVRSVLGDKAPELPAPDVTQSFPRPEGFESTAVQLDPAQKTLSLESARDALSRLRYLARVADRQGVNANGITKHDLNEARRALQDLVYEHRPDFAPLDRQYATLMDHEGQTEDLLSAIQASRSAHSSGTAYGSKPGSLGGSLPRGAHSALNSLLDAITTNKGAVADATQRMVIAPNATVQGLLDAAPSMSRVGRGVRGGALPQVVPQLRGLLFPINATEPQTP